ncbi:MAG: hypothetical protein BAJALOKI3v1_350033 [Promethearchaeota archaeon]|nr:MAG: hypothetical protein BAJALOKI3v1_350033 [Candidatus Lokiarchaeota archaeon]
MKLILDKSFQVDKLKLYLKLFKLHKSYLAFLSDQKEMGIGDVTLGSPQRIKGVKSTSSTYHLFGIQQKLLSSVITKRMTNFLDMPVLLLLFIKEKVEENEIARPIVDFINENLKDLRESEELLDY